MKRKINDQLIEIYPVGNWVVKKKSIITLVNKVRKIEVEIDTPENFNLEELFSDALEEELLMAPYSEGREEIMDEFAHETDRNLENTEKEIEDEIFNVL